MRSKKRKTVSVSLAARGRSSPSPRVRLVGIRTELRTVIGKLKALECEDSMILVEFWQALDWVNGED